MSINLINTRYLENDTGMVTQSRYYELTEFDNKMLVKIGQILFFAFCTVFISIADGFIIRTIFKRENLQTIANILIAVLFIIEIGYTVFFTITSSVAIAVSKIWLTKSTAKVLSFWSMVFPHLQYVTVALMSFEKYIYCVYPFKHQIWFTEKKTFIAFGVTAILITLYIFVVNLTYPASFFPTAVLCYQNFTERTIYVNSTIFYALAPFRILFQFGSYAWIVLFQSLTFASSIRTRIQIGYRGVAPNMPQQEQTRMWRRLLISAFSLFSVVILYMLSWSWFAIAILKPNTLSSVTERIRFILTIFLPPIINTVAILLGNRPLRKAVLNTTPKPSWLQERTGMAKVENQLHLPIYDERMSNKDEQEQCANRECVNSHQKNKQKPMLLKRNRHVQANNQDDVDGVNTKLPKSVKKQKEYNGELNNVELQTQNDCQQITSEQRLSIRSISV